MSISDLVISSESVTRPIGCGYFLGRLLDRGFERERRGRGARKLDRVLALQLAPADQRAARGGEDRAHHHRVHHLPEAEALEEEPPQKLPLLLLLQREGDAGGEPVNGEEERVVEGDLLEVEDRVP